MKRSTSRILTTHAGSSAAPGRSARDGATPSRSAGVCGPCAPRSRSTSSASRSSTVWTSSDDGEMSKPSFITYVTERLSGFTRSTEPGTLPWAGSKEVTAFPEFYAPMLREAPTPRRRASLCTGPITCHRPRAGAGRHHLTSRPRSPTSPLPRRSFPPSRRPMSRAGRENLTCKTEEEYLFAIAEAMHEEYGAIAPGSLPAADRRPRGW